MFRLEGTHRADAAIIGSGLTGLMLAASLSQAGMRIIVLAAEESSSMPSFETASLLHGHALGRMKGIYGLTAAQQYTNSLLAHLYTLQTSSLPYLRSTAMYTYAVEAADLPALESQYQTLTSFRKHLLSYCTIDMFA